MTPPEPPEWMFELLTPDPARIWTPAEPEREPEGERIAQLELELAEREQEIERLEEQLVQAEEGKPSKPLEASSPTLSVTTNKRTHTQTWEMSGWVNGGKLFVTSVVTEQLLREGPKELLEMIRRDLPMMWLRQLGKELGILDGD